jgi:broad specificity phosphatase PhoE
VTQDTLSSHRFLLFSCPFPFSIPILLISQSQLPDFTSVTNFRLAATISKSIRTITQQHYKEYARCPRYHHPPEHIQLTDPVPITTIHCVRHAQGYHNLSIENQALPDPSLTPLGEQQCLALRDSFPYHSKVTHLVASPMRRTIYTCALGFDTELNDRGLVIHALPEIQEFSDHPSDTGSSKAKLEQEFDAPTSSMKGMVDFSLVLPGWNYKTTGRFSPDVHAIEQRAKEARIWLRELGKRSGKDADIVVVTHGGFLHFFTDDWEGHEKYNGVLLSPTSALNHHFENWKTPAACEWF